MRPAVRTPCGKVIIYSLHILVPSRKHDLINFIPVDSGHEPLEMDFLPGVNAKGRPLYGTRPDGLMPRHVYSVLRAVEVPGEIWEEPKRMVCLRNPWGRCEWQGPWKDQGAQPGGCSDILKKNCE